MDDPQTDPPGPGSHLGEAELRAVFQSVSDAILVIDPATVRVVDCNQRACEVFGFDPEEVRGAEIGTFCQTESQDSSERAAEAVRAAAAGEPQSVEGRARGGQGESFWVEASLRSATVGDEPRVLGVIRDVTDRKRRRQDLEEEHERYSVLVEQSPAGVVIVQDEEFKFVNQAMAELTGRSVEDLEGSPFSEVMAGEYRTLVRERYQERIRGEEPPKSYEVEVGTAAGDRRIVDLEVSTVTLDGEPATMATFNDVTERRRRERELQETKLTLEALVSALPDVVTLKDREGTELVAFDSSATEDLLVGKPISAGGSQDVADIFPAETASRVRDTIEKAIESGSVQTFEYRLDTPAGMRWFEAKVAPLEEPIDGTEAAVWVARDITDRTERERELGRQNERLERFANVVSHDLRNPLSVAVGHAELLEDEDHGPVIQANLERMAAIIGDVLTLARDGQTVEETEPVVLSAIARQAWGQVESEDATLSVEHDVEVGANRGRFTRLLENLFRNSVQHVGDDVAIRVGSIPEGFYLEDDGPGIPEATRSKVFEHGYTTSKSGTGLGLNIVQDIAAAHDWTVEITDGTDGGSRFEFTTRLPETHTQ
ncbi:MAG: PAS domain S-box protein [Haloarculaceae archaeon]